MSSGSAATSSLGLARCTKKAMAKNQALENTRYHDPELKLSEFFFCVVYVFLTRGEALGERKQSI
jgi:hypothetical protein